MPKVTPMQSLLLNHAASRENGSLFPLPEDIIHPPTSKRSIKSMIRLGWLEDEGLEAISSSQGDPDCRVSLTPAGRAVIGAAEAEAIPDTLPADTHRLTKVAQVIALLSREGGATLDDLTKATGWLPHTTRAALTGLRKKGHVLDREKRGTGVSRYWIVAA
ncbi:DUF3489 domain-containing protein [Sphingomonas sp. Y38-1Y]|uniref:DUF3489 domain-containing protein n=1 Tax=Sphingomonas sp. Y38-1Y TaxID=3078265 RepID=UPI0028E19822|nr:DUF3489 domain-containing protein [Sphingomonas sp. Y38-1Y]